MSTQPPDPSSGNRPIDQPTLRYIRRALTTHHPSDEPFVFSKPEARLFRFITWQTVCQSALLGALGVLLFYLPRRFWPDFFADTLLRISGTQFVLPLITLLYACLLLYIELYALLWLNGRAVRVLMGACQFPRAHDAQYERHLHAIAEAAAEHPYSRFMRFGLLPYFALPRWGLTLYFITTKAKAILASALLAVLIGELTGYYVAGLIGLPIHAAWNAWASWTVLKEVRVRIMAPLTIRSFVDELFDQWQHNEAFCQLMPEALHYVAVPSRQHNYAHLLLTETLMDRFGLRVIRPTGQFTALMTKAPADVRAAIGRLLVFSAVLDGGVSGFEQRQLNRLRSAGWLAHSRADVQRLQTAYVAGHGLWI